MAATPTPVTFTFPCRILFGDGAIGSLQTELARLGVSRPLVVTDREALETERVGRVIDRLVDAVVLDAARSDPTEADCLAGRELYRDRGRDGLIGLGWGGSIDTVKGIRLLVNHPGRLADLGHSADGEALADPPPMIAVPTTAGDGGEVRGEALIQIPERGPGAAVIDARWLPSAAIVDPELTHDLPPLLTASGGMAALSQAIESYLSTTIHPICDGIALEGLRFVAHGLEAAIRDGRDREARRSLMIGALMAGIGSHKGRGVVHALVHALRGESRSHPGVLSAILLPHALRFNRPAAEARLGDLAARLGLGRSGDGPGHLITLVELLACRLPLPRRLGQVEGLDRSRVADHARIAVGDPGARTNPRSCGESDLVELIEQAW